MSRRDRVGKKKTLDFFHTLSFVNVQCCVRISASNFEVLPRNSGGARAFENAVRFLAGPAPSDFRFCKKSVVTSQACELQTVARLKVLHFADD